MKIRFAHFVRDDNKFIPDSMWCFENSGLCDNSFFIVKKNTTRLKDIRVTKLNKNDILSTINKGRFDAICLHSLYSFPLELIPNIDKSIKVFWYSWGYDIYENPEPSIPLFFDLDIYMDETKTCMKTSHSLIDRYAAIKSIVKRKLTNTYYTTDQLLRSIERIDYFAGVFPIEYEMLKKRYSNFHAKRINHNYIHPSEFNLASIDQPSNITDCNIQLGHSACYADNHIDIMSKIVDYVKPENKIICPLSYGGTKSYVEKVLSKGKYYFGSRFLPLVKFLPFDEYCKIQDSCNKFVLGAIRQQATCNCLSALWGGMQLFLPSNSINYIQYKRFNLRVNGIDNESVRSLEFLHEDLKNNRKIIENIYSYRAWVNDLKDSLCIAFDYKHNA